MKSYLITKLARVVVGNIDPRSFEYILRKISGQHCPPWSLWLGSKRLVYHEKALNNVFYYSFKLFPRLVKTTRIIHHNLLLFTKFGKNLRHIESITPKVQPAENY